MLGEFLKKSRGDRTLGQISATSSLDKGYLSKVERGILVPKLDKVIPLSKAYRVPLLDLLSNLLELDSEDLKKMLNGDTKKTKLHIETCSEAQRAMLKCHLRQLLEVKTQSVSFTTNSDFLKAINSNSDVVLPWFYELNNYLLDNKINDILNYLKRTEEDIFDDMMIVIQPNEAKALNLRDIKDVPDYPLIISGNELYPKLKGLSLKSLNLLGKNISEQIIYVPEEYSKTTNTKNNISDDISQEFIQMTEKNINLK